MNVIYGSSTGLTSADDQFWNQDSSGSGWAIDDASESWDEFGKGLVAADFDGDTPTDLVIGVWAEGLSSLSNTGAAHVLYGEAGNGLQASSPADQFWNQDSTDVNSQEVEDDVEGDDRFGWQPV